MATIHNIELRKPWSFPTLGANFLLSKIAFHSPVLRKGMAKKGKKRKRALWTEEEKGGK